MDAERQVNAPDARDAPIDDAPIDDAPIDDAELAALALAADPDPEVPADAVPFGVERHHHLLPEWYMPAPQRARRTVTARLVVGAVVAGLLLVNGVGLCVTYGLPEIAW